MSIIFTGFLIRNCGFWICNSSVFLSGKRAVIETDFIPNLYMCVATLPKHLVKKSTILNRYFLCFIYRKPCTLNSLLTSMVDLRLHRWSTFHSTPEEFTSSVFKWMKSTKETAFPAGKKKKIMNITQWELHALWNIIITVRSLLSCS